MRSREIETDLWSRELAGVDETGGRSEEEAVSLDVDSRKTQNFVFRLQLQLHGDFSRKLQILHPLSESQLLAWRKVVVVAMESGATAEVLGFVGFNFKHSK